MRTPFINAMAGVFLVLMGHCLGFSAAQQKEAATIIEGKFPRGEWIQILPPAGLPIPRPIPVNGSRYDLTLPRQPGEIINGKLHLRIAFLRDGRIVEVGLFPQGEKNIYDIEEQ